MDRLIHEIVDRLLQDIEERDEIDMVSDFAMVLPTEIISFMLGIPEEYRKKLRGYSVSILGALDPVVSAKGMAAGNQAVTEFSTVLDD